MSSFVKIKRIAITSTFVLILLAGKAQAYLDISTGTYMFQIVIAGLFGAILSLKLFWGNVRKYIISISSRILPKKKDAR
jgi:hypothetical protein